MGTGLLLRYLGVEESGDWGFSMVFIRGVYGLMIAALVNLMCSI